MKTLTTTLEKSRPKKFRMIAIDLDGTLLTPDGRVSRRTVSAIRTAVSAGFLICYATGRTWPECEAILEAIGHDDLSVFVGGAMVVDTRARKILHRSIMRPRLAADICSFFEARGRSALALQDASDVEYLVSGREPFTRETETWRSVTGTTVRVLAALGDLPHSNTLRVSTAVRSDESAALLQEINLALGPRIQSHSVPFHGYGFDLIEVFDPAVSKWQGLLHVAEICGVDPKTVIAIGDNFNDLSMIQNAGLGVAMGNAKEAVKAAAQRVIGANDAEGVAVFLEELAAGD